MRNDSTFPPTDTVMHVALIGVFALMLFVTVLVPDVLSVTI